MPPARPAPTPAMLLPAFEVEDVGLLVVEVADPGVDVVNVTLFIDPEVPDVEGDVELAVKVEQDTEFGRLLIPAVSQISFAYAIEAA
jgi:hypothetical protein